MSASRPTERTHLRVHEQLTPCKVCRTRCCREACPSRGGYEQSVIDATLSHDPESLTGVRKNIPRELVVDRFGEIIASAEWRFETPGQFVSPNQPLLLRYPR